MKCSVLISCLMLMIVVASVNAVSLKRRFESCTNSQECVTRYCRDGRCILRSDSVDEKKFPDQCDPSPCECGETCYYQQVQCFAPPCPAVANCV